MISPCFHVLFFVLVIFWSFPEHVSTTRTLKEEVLDKIAALVTAAFGLVAALAWNDAIKVIFKEIFGEESTIGPMLLYAIIVTIIAVILTIIVARAVANAKNK